MVKAFLRYTMCPRLTDSPFFSSIDMVGLSVILADPSVAPTVLNVMPSLVQAIDIESPNWDRSLQIRWNSEDAKLTTTLGEVSCILQYMTDNKNSKDGRE